MSRSRNTGRGYHRIPRCSNCGIITNGARLCPMCAIRENNSQWHETEDPNLRSWGTNIQEANRTYERFRGDDQVDQLNDAANEVMEHIVETGWNPLQTLKRWFGKK